MNLLKRKIPGGRHCVFISLKLRRWLIERVFQDEDRRVRKLRLTRKGQQLIRRREQKQLVRIDAALHGLTEDEIGRVLAGLDILTKVSTQPETATA